VLVPMRFGPQVSRFPGGYKDDDLPIIALEDAAFDETFKADHDIFDENLSPIREFRALLRIERRRQDVKDRAVFSVSFIIGKLLSHGSAIRRTDEVSQPFQIATTRGRVLSAMPILREPEGAKVVAAARAVEDAVQHDWGRIAAPQDPARPEDVSILSIEGA
jgi:hypothetical protein